jgi:heat shock protein HtpX
MGIYEEISANKAKTLLLMGVFFAFVMGIIFIILYIFDVWFGLLGVFGIFLIVVSIIQYYRGDKLVLKLHKAKLARKDDYPYYINTVDGLSIAAGIPKPKAYVIEEKAMNAFATGRDPKHASVACTTGLLERMDRKELEGVLAHEISHIKNYDIRLMTLATALVGVLALVSDVLLRSIFWGGMGRKREGGNAIIIVAGLVLALLSPFIAKMITLSVSRNREYLADASGAMLTRYPPGLASALGKLAADHTPMKSASVATENLYISNPLKKGFFHNMFSTHPPIKERIARLKAM